MADGTIILPDPVSGSCIVWVVPTEQKQTAGIGNLKKPFLSPPPGDDDLLNDFSFPWVLQHPFDFQPIADFSPRIGYTSSAGANQIAFDSSRLAG